MAHCYVTSESKKAFTFIFDCLKDLFFYDCQGPSVIVGDFALGLSTAMAAKRTATVAAEGGVEAIRELAEFDEVDTEVKLQLCT